MTPLIRDIPVPGGSVRIESRGAGPCVLFLHGLSASRRTWHALAPFLEDRFRLHLPDLLGRGESEPAPREDYRLAAEAERVRRLVAALDEVPALVVGHSQGAALALALAAADVRIRGLLLVNPVTPWTPRPRLLDVLEWAPARRAAAALGRPLRRRLARRILARTYGPERAVTTRDVARYAHPFADPRRARTLMRVLADWRPAELSEHLPARPLAVRILVGEADRRIGVARPASLAERLDASFHCVEGAGHILPEERPELVARAVAALHADVLGGEGGPAAVRSVRSAAGSDRAAAAARRAERAERGTDGPAGGSAEAPAAAAAAPPEEERVGAGDRGIGESTWNSLRRGQARPGAEAGKEGEIGR